MRFDTLSVEVEGDLDVRGSFGLDPKVRPGFGALRVALRIQGPESPAKYEVLRRVVDAHCPVFDLCSNAAPVKVEMRVG